jgi:drug/metabolite transporter (DMT)-like permease
MYSALATGEVGVVSSIVAASPLAAFVFSGILLREERLDGALILGMLTVLVGVVVVLN